MSDNWEIQTFGKGTPYPFVLVDNWYLPHEEEAVWSEIDFYMRNAFIFKPTDDTDPTVARDSYNKSKAKNQRVFLDGTQTGSTYTTARNYTEDKLWIGAKYDG